MSIIDSSHGGGVMPSFFIAGAPKCGTSSLYTYLSEHSSVFMPRVKEPGYYCTDLPSIRYRRSRQRYEALFSAAPRGALVGEGSVWYLMSRDAVPAIMSDNPKARFILLLRNPVQAVQSLHLHNLRTLDEDNPSFEEAWRLQAERSSGRCLPRYCRQRQFIQYSYVYDYGEQLGRIFQSVPRSQIQVLIFEEMVADLRTAYLQVLTFLGLDDDGRTLFPVANEAAAPRNRFATRLMRTAVAPIYRELADRPSFQRVWRWGERAGAPSFNQVKESLQSTYLEPGARMKLGGQFTADLVEHFKPVVEQTERLLSRPIPIWHCDTQD